MTRFLLILALLGLTACAAPQIQLERDGGIGGTGDAVQAEVV